MEWTSFSHGNWVKGKMFSMLSMCRLPRERLLGCVCVWGGGGGGGVSAQMLIESCRFYYT